MSQAQARVHPQELYAAEYQRGDLAEPGNGSGT
jgi:hypothetical protein